MKRAVKVLEALVPGDTSRDVAYELKISIKVACAALSELHALGLVRRTGQVPHRGRGRPMWTYEKVSR